MPTTNSSTPFNRLIAALPGAERQHFLAGCEPVTLTFGEILAEPGTPLAHVYFPTDSFIVYDDNDEQGLTPGGDAGWG